MQIKHNLHKSPGSAEPGWDTKNDQQGLKIIGYYYPNWLKPTELKGLCQLAFNYDERTGWLRVSMQIFLPEESFLQE